MPQSADEKLKTPWYRLPATVIAIQPLQWLVLFGFLVVTVVVWQRAVHSNQERISVQFDRQANYSIDLFKQQIGRYAVLLESGLAFVASSEEVEPEEWLQFTRRVGLKTRYIALNAMGVAYRVETGEVDGFIEEQQLKRPDFAIIPALDRNSFEDRQFILPITLIAPEVFETNGPGVDLTRESRRIDAIERSIKTGRVQITAPVTPYGIQDAGIIMMAPIFETSNPENEENRQAELVGIGFAAVLTEKLASGILENDIRQVAIKVSDKTDVMYNEWTDENDDLDPKPLMTTSLTVLMYGRNWRFDIQSTNAFRIAQSNNIPILTLVCGLVLNGLLFLLLLHMSRERQRVATFGDLISQKYESQSKILQNRCKDLEAFSYLVSHDLKAPLHAIGYLAECFDEDFGGHHPEVTLHPELKRKISLISKQVVLSLELIKGVLQYSGLDSEVEACQEVNTLEVLNSLRITLTAQENKLHLIGEFPTFTTYRVQLTQVLMNLINNGYKYHHGQGPAVVTVSIERSPRANYYRVTVADNGPGIAPAHHKKIFKPFITLQRKEQSMSSGVGLAIVYRLVTQHGGLIEIDSEKGRGACFSFDWPCLVPGQDVSEYVDVPKAA